jgi:hypothetical protein
VTEPGLNEVVQGYELSMTIVVRIIRLLGGPEARPSAISFMYDQQGPDAAYREALGCPVCFQRTWCGFEIVLAAKSDAMIDAAPSAKARKATPASCRTGWAPAPRLA